MRFKCYGHQNIPSISSQHRDLPYASCLNSKNGTHKIARKNNANRIKNTLILFFAIRILQAYHSHIAGLLLAFFFQVHYEYTKSASEGILRGVASAPISTLPCNA